MKTFRIARNLRASILAAFSVLLFLSFTLVGAAFNIAVSQYIRSSAVAMLNEARAIHYNLLDYTPAEAPILRIVGNRPNLFRANLRFFMIDENYQPLNPHASDSAYDISRMLYQAGLDPAETLNMRLRGPEHNQSYFITSARAPGEQERFIIFYVDVTEMQGFTRSINMMLVTLAALIWVAAIAVTGFLAGTLAKPLHILRDFARRIGRGDFTPNPISFANEEFEALNQSLNHTAKQLAKYDNDQKTFFQNVSHELRTPLMTIKSYAEGIKYGIMDPDKSAQTILEASNRLSGMVDDVLYISRIDNITMPVMERTDIRILIQERISLQRPLADLKQLSINFESSSEPLYVNCASSYMGRALDNLISNAIRFAESVITVECRREGGQVMIRVTDDGPGFEPELLPHVFERFFKGKNGLSGIGLSVVRSIVEHHKGTAMAKNNEEENGKGAVLTIFIPQI